MAQTEMPGALGSNDQLGAPVFVDCAAHKERARVNRYDCALIAIAVLFAAVLAGLAWIFWAAHSDAPLLRADCEARGGMLIRTPSPLYACVATPPKAASR